MATRNVERREPVIRGTGNVFADLGFPDAAERQAKLRLAYALNQVLEARKLSQADAAKVLGLTQPKVSALRHYKLAGFSVERLMNLLTARRPGCRDRDPAKASLPKSWANHGDCGLSDRQPRNKCTEIIPDTVSGETAFITTVTRQLKQPVITPDQLSFEVVLSDWAQGYLPYQVLELLAHRIDMAQRNTG